MRNARTSSTHLARLASLMLAGAWMGGVVGSSQQTAAFGPILELEKTVYQAGESVRFWIGVTGDVDIPDALHQSGIVHWVYPDGTKIDEHVGWPMDGNPSRFGKGGWGFGNRSPSPGRYVVSFEFAGQITPAQLLEILPDSFSKSIEARWIFPDTSSAGGLHARNVLLHIENKSGRVLRIAKPGLVGSEVSFNVKAFEPLSSESMFVPQSALLRADEIPSIIFFKLDWDNQSRWPMIIVPGGDSLDRNLPLESLYSFRDGKEYEFSIGTVLIVFAGESRDSDASLFPLRIPVSATTRFRW